MEFNRQDTIEKMNIMASQGAFDGFQEESMTFEDLSDEELFYYASEWIVEHD